LRVDRITEAFELLSRNPQLSVSLNGNESLHLKIAEAEIPKVNALPVEHGFQVMELSPQRESLEQVFLRLTQDARTSK
jgi:hypothetical protein